MINFNLFIQDLVKLIIRLKIWVPQIYIIFCELIYVLITGKTIHSRKKLLESKLRYKFDLISN